MVVRQVEDLCDQGGLVGCPKIACRGKAGIEPERAPIAAQSDDRNTVAAELAH